MLLIDFGNRIDSLLNEEVVRIYRHLKGLTFPFIKDIVPGYSSLAVYYDALLLTVEHGGSPFQTISTIIKKALQKTDAIFSEKRQLRVPVCYSLAFGPELKIISRQTGLSNDDIIQLHTSGTYRVYMIGFLPGFAYMGEVDERIAMPRLLQPRTSVPEGSVGIAGKQTGIYPLASPGGWNIIGRTPLKLFDKDKEAPTFFNPGDEVTFYSITEDEFAHY